MVFRITRNADIEREEEDADDLLEMIEEELRKRKFASPVRLEFGPNLNPRILELLKNELNLQEDDPYQYSVPLHQLDLRPLYQLNRPELKNAPIVPTVPLAFMDEKQDIFCLIRKGDILVHHPHESLTATVENFIAAAASDPKVIAIKMVIYRTGEDSPFIPMLIQAAEAGKQVVCMVELKARFDEAKNIHVAHALGNAGVHVVYGIVGLKTHSKVTLVVRQEPDGARCYTHIGTGNYNTHTARLYTDLGLFTSKKEFTDDVVHFFHYLTGRSDFQNYQKLLVAPIQLKERFLTMIDNEIILKRAKKPAHIIAKMNSLEDKQICRALYRASQEGVSIDLIVRGFCCLRPQVPGMSESIRVISVVGQLLEHSRIFYFRNGATDPLNGSFFIGSADWMHRNLSARVEVVAPIEDRPLRQKCWQILTLMLSDQRQAWDLDADGIYLQRKGTAPEDVIGSQAKLAQLACGN